MLLLLLNERVDMEERVGPGRGSGEGGEVELWGVRVGRRAWVWRWWFVGGLVDTADISTAELWYRQRNLGHHQKNLKHRRGSLAQRQWDLEILQLNLTKSKRNVTIPTA